MNDSVHIVRMSHDGSGTVITSIHLASCVAPLQPARCQFCQNSIPLVTLTLDGARRLKP